MASDATEMCIVASAADDGIATVIVEELRERGLGAIRHSSDCGRPRNCTVIVSPAALGDSAWVAAVEQHSGDRFIPVRYREMPRHARYPAELGRWNFLDWDPLHPGTFYDRLFDTARTDLRWQDQHRVLLAEARAWAGRGKPDHLLIQDRSRAFDAGSHLGQTADRLAGTAPLLADFVGRSRTLARRTRLKRYGRIGLRLGIAGLVVLIAVTILDVLQTPKSNNTLAAALTLTMLDTDRPDRIGLLGAALYAQGGVDTAGLATERVLHALAQPWPLGTLSPDSAPLTAGDLLDDGTAVVTVDGAGVVSRWDTTTDQVVWSHTAVDGPVSGLDAAPDGSQLALAGPGRDVTVLDVDPWQRRTIELPAPVTRVLVLPGGAGWVAATEEGRLHAIGPDLSVTEVGGTAAVLALTVTDGRARALVRPTADSLALLDLPGGAVVAQTAWAPHDFDRGSLAPDGNGVAVVGPGGQVFAARQGLDLAPTGTVVPDVATQLALLPGSLLAVGSNQYGVSLYDLDRRLRLGQICASMALATELVVAGRDDRIGCLGDGVVELWSTSWFRPVPAPATDPGGPALEVTSGPYRLVGLPSGSFRLYGVTDDFLSALGALAPITHVAIRPDGRSFAIGAADGAVIEFDIGPDTIVPVTRWRAPDHAPVQSLAWDDDSGQLLVRTAGGAWWAAPSCSGCSLSVDELFERVRPRLSGCYGADQLRALDDSTREFLEITECPPLPEPEGD